ncbi:MAG: DUF3021 domain-containing protein [Ruminococcus sp.]|nr:DUF3021 domain-containing protein [Ruminococcus sp.]
MKDTVRMVISHFFIITVCVMAAIGVSNLFSSDPTGYPKEFPLHMLLVGASTALPSFLFYSRRPLNRRRFLLRSILHFFCILTIVLTEGHFLNWYNSFAGAAVIAGMIVIVYAAVWIITLRSNNKTEQSINEALKSYNADTDDEE